MLTCDVWHITCTGIGPTRALTLVQKHGCLEKVLDSLDSSKYPIPDPFPYHEARRLFQGWPTCLALCSQPCGI